MAQFCRQVKINGDNRPNRLFLSGRVTDKTFKGLTVGDRRQWCALGRGSLLSAKKLNRNNCEVLYTLVYVHLRSVVGKHSAI